MKRGFAFVYIATISLILSICLIDAKEAAVLTSPFIYSFSSSGTLYEAGSDSESSSPYFYLNSGAKMILSNGTGKTVQGNLLSADNWRLIYLESNPIDTDLGYHPQNLFRLVTRQKWKNYSQEVDFKINGDQLSSSSNRDGHNGVLFFNRYVDGDNLYYTGIRVDGQAVIKKKQNGVYYTLALKKIYDGSYDRYTNPNLIPKNKWMGLKSEIYSYKGEVYINLYLDQNNNGNYVLIASVKDYMKSYGTPIDKSGYTGIRTDFMDVEFDNYILRNI